MKPENNKAKPENISEKKEKEEVIMADYIRTYSGVQFYPTEPDPGEFRIEDIAHALSLICRGNGHVRSFWSVGEHCICCAKEAQARGLGKRMALACLLHDAGECYLSDIPRPFKKSLPQYRELEDRMLDMIFEKFLGSKLTEEEQKDLKKIDDDLLWYDLEILLGEPLSEPEPDVHVKPDYTVRPFEDVEREYLELFRQLSDGVS